MRAAIPEFLRYYLVNRSEPGQGADHLLRLLHGYVDSRPGTNGQMPAQAVLEMWSVHRQQANMPPAMVFVAAVRPNLRPQPLFVSSQCYALTGFTADEAQAELRWLRVIPRDDRTQLREAYLAAVDRCQPVYTHFRLEHRDGYSVWVSLEAEFVPDETGRPIFWHGLIRDVTQDRIAENQLRYHASIVYHLSDPIISSDLQGRVVGWNLSAEETYGWSQQEVLGQYVDDVLHTMYLSTDQATAQRHLAQNGYWRGQVIQQRKNGEQVYIMSTVSMVRDDTGQPLSIIGVNRDITRQKETEQALVELNASLEERVHERTFELELLNEIMQRISYALSYDDMLRLLLDNLHQVMRFDVAAGLLPDGDHNELMLRAQAPLDPEIQAIIENEVENTFQRLTGRLVDFYTVTKILPGGEGRPPIRDIGSKLVVPIVGDGPSQAIGVLYVGASESWSFSEAQMRLIYTVANKAAVPVQRLRALLADEQRRLDQLLENLPDGVLLLDHQWRVVHANPAARAYLSLLNAGTVDDDLTHLGDLSRAEMERAGADWLETQLSDSDPPRMFEVAAQPTDLAGESGGWQLTIRDITARKESEMELRMALDKARELNDLKSRFVSMASHEFRTPLTVIMSSADMLRHYRDKLKPDQQDQHFNRINTQIQHMVTMLEDTLIIGRLEAGTNEFKPQLMDLATFTRNMVDEVRDANETHRVEFSAEPGKMLIEGDQKLMRQVVNNLITNAIKYSPAGSVVQVHLQKRWGQIMLQVSDQGIGIHEGDQQRIFEAFHRGKNVATIAGTGLGLAIVKRAVALHGGSITFDSEVGSGTTFVVTIPEHSLNVLS